ncbi:MAG: hypothetical protein AAF827_21100, partial [Cyanobacteria bacterium P01_D01_bin.6]
MKNKSYKNLICDCGVCNDCRNSQKLDDFWADGLDAFEASINGVLADFMEFDENIDEASKRSPRNKKKRRIAKQRQKRSK